MKTSKAKKVSEMRSEYDFSVGTRGKHWQKYRSGHSVRIIRENKPDELRFFSEEDGSVMLDPDVKAHFPTEKSVNRALRALIHAHQ